MITGILSLITTALGASFLISRKKEDLPIVEDPTMIDEDVLEEEEENDNDPRKGAMYFGNRKEKYDPFYDYTNDDVYSSQEALNMISGIQNALSRAYRCRIIRPFFAMSDPKRLNVSKLDSSNSIQKNQLYSTFGVGPKNVFMKDWPSNKEPFQQMPVMPFFRGEYNVIDFVVEVFNPFDFEAPLSKLRFSGLTCGGDKCYPLMPNFGGIDYSIYDRTTKDAAFNLKASPFAQTEYWSNYLMRAVPTSDIKYDEVAKQDSRLEMDFKLAPSDFEIDMVKNADELFDLSAIYHTQGISYSLEKSGSNYRDLKAYYSKPAIAIELLQKIEQAYKWEDRDGTKVVAGVESPTERVAEKMMIPARGSVLVRVKMPIVKEPKIKFRANGKVYHEYRQYLAPYRVQYDYFNNTKAYYKPFSILEVPSKEEMSILFAEYGGLKAGGCLFYDLEAVNNMRGKDFEMKIAAFASSSDSVINNHASGKNPRAENCNWCDCGMFSGSRPNAQSYDYCKSYYEGYGPYEGLYEAYEDQGFELNSDCYDEYYNFSKIQ
ncbi:MAG: hypothetical protein MJZ30_09445 [Paludibacteraceae bacterium]|nr:hypothetical protein [Paludibacteraceae bacterium]